MHTFGRGVIRSLAAAGLLLSALVAVPVSALAQQPLGQTSAATSPSEESTFESTIDAGSLEGKPKRQLVNWNEYQGPYFTIRVGGGFLYEVAAYAQDGESKEQFALSPDGKLRDFRFILNGRLPAFERSITWCAGIMYDAPTHSWLIRQTGVMIEAPELSGHFFIGRAKEGFSLNKVMTGYDGWTMERSTINDATIPILADGIKWLGYSRQHGLLWNLGYFNDLLSKGQSFSSYSSQAVARIAWLPILSDADGTLLHAGVNLRFGKPVDDKLRLRSRPEVFPAPYFVQMAQLDAASTRMAGPEIYYRNRSWIFGSEYWFQNVSSETAGDPVFHGGDVVAIWLVTGETRAYNTVGGYFKAVSPARPVFEGGPGAWELVSRFSFIDLDSGPVRGGKFWRFTPMVNWHLSDNVRLELAYGYGNLDRFSLSGRTHFFQSRIQLQL